MKKINLQGIHLTPRDRDALAAPAAEPVRVDWNAVVDFRTQNGERLFPAAAVRRPGRRGAVRIV